MSRKPGKAAGGRKYTTSLIIGVLLVPLSAVAAVALVGPDDPPETDDSALVVETTTSSTVGEVAEVVIPEIATDEDLAAACGEQGMILVAKEADGTISALEQAALDSLRAICEEENLGLPGPPTPDPVVETVTVVASPGSDDEDASSDGSDDAAAEFEEAYAETVAHINAAIDDGARGEKIALAERLVEEAASLADAGDYESGMRKLAEARRAADEADRGHGEDDDDHDDDDHDDHDDHEDDEDEEDEEDEDDDH